MVEQNNCHASLTETGINKMDRRAQGEDVTFIPGADYKVKASGGENWVPIQETEASTYK